MRAIGDEFGSGRMLSGEIKAKLIACLSLMIATHQENRAKVSDATVDQFFSTAPRDFDAMFGALSGDIPAPPGEKEAVSFQGGNTWWREGRRFRAAAGPTATAGADAGGGAGDAPLSKNALKKIQKEKEIAEKKRRRRRRKPRRRRRRSDRSLCRSPVSRFIRHYRVGTAHVGPFLAH